MGNSQDDGKGRHDSCSVSQGSCPSKLQQAMDAGRVNQRRWTWLNSDVLKYTEKRFRWLGSMWIKICDNYLEK